KKVILMMLMNHSIVNLLIYHLQIVTRMTVCQHQKQPEEPVCMYQEFQPLLLIICIDMVLPVTLTAILLNSLGTFTPGVFDTPCNPDELTKFKLRGAFLDLSHVKDVHLVANLLKSYLSEYPLVQFDSDSFNDFVQALGTKITIHILTNLNQISTKE